MKFRVYGVSKESGKDLEVVLDAENKEAAEKTAFELNVLVYAQKTREHVEQEPVWREPQDVPVVEEQPAPIRDTGTAHEDSVNKIPLLASTAYEKPTSNRLAIASIVMGVAALAICMVPTVQLLSIPLAALGFLLATIGLSISFSRKHQGVGFAIFGIACNATPLVVGILVTGAFLTFVTSPNKAFSEMYNTMYSTSFTTQPEDATSSVQHTTTPQRGSISEGGSKDTETRLSATEIIFPTVSNKHMADLDDIACIWVDVSFNPENLVKPTRAVKGALVFADLFGEVKLQLTATINDPLRPNVPYKKQGIGFEYNQSSSKHNWIKNTALEDMQISYRVDSIIYEDGEQQDF